MTTSQLAFRQLSEDRAEMDRRAILNVLRQTSGATDEEIQELAGIDPNSQRPRRVELVQRSLVRDSQRRRLTRSGRKAKVWVLA